MTKNFRARVYALDEYTSQVDIEFTLRQAKLIEEPLSITVKEETFLLYRKEH